MFTTASTTPGKLVRPLVATALTLALTVPSVLAQTMTDIDFTLDWRIEGPSAPFLMALERGYFEEEGLNVTIDAGSGSAGAVTRVATGAYDMGFADFNALVEHSAANPEESLQAVYMVYNSTPAAVFASKAAGIETPQDLVGKTLGAPVFDGGRKAWPSFAAANGLEVDSVTWEGVDPAIRETLMAQERLDGITGFYFTSLPNLEERGMDMDDVTVMLYAEYGVPLYGNAIIASADMMRDNPDAVAAFNRAFNRALVETIEDPATAITYVKGRDGLIDEELELRRLTLALDFVVVTDDTRRDGLGSVTMARLETAIDEVVSSFGLDRTPAAANLFNMDMLPERASRDVPEH